MGRTTNLPAASPASGNNRANFGNSSVRVTHACTIVRSALSNSVPIPEGISIDTTLLFDALIAKITPFTGSLTSPRTPVPNKASTTTVFSVNGKLSIVQRSTSSGSRSQFVRHSGVICSGAYTPHTAQRYPTSLNIRATAKPSPPLFPFPTTNSKGVSRPIFCSIHRAIDREARSIRSRLLIGSCSIVYRSASRISLPVNIFIIFSNFRQGTFIVSHTPS